jgi:hypothetical protein
LTEADPIVERLEGQIAWYDRNSLSAQRTFKRCKVVEIIAAALIPLLTGLRFSEAVWIAGGLGVVVTAIEGVVHLNQYQQNWITYRSTCEALKHEKYLYLAKAGPLRERSRSASAAGRKDRSGGVAGAREMSLSARAGTQTQGRLAAFRPSAAAVVAIALALVFGQ